MEKIYEEQRGLSRIEKQEERRRKLLVIIVMALILLIGFNVGEIVAKIPTRPGVESVSDEWYSSKTVRINKDSKSKNGIKYYLYCISKSKDGRDCKWKRTRSKNVKVTEEGLNYVFFKAVSKKGREGVVSKVVEVRIDTKEPEISEIKIEKTANSIKLNIDALDKESGVAKYYYSIDGKEFIEGVSEKLFNGLESSKNYKIRIRIEDKVGNIKEIEFEVETLKKDVKEPNNSVDDKEVPKEKDKKKEESKKEEQKQEDEEEHEEEKIKDLPEMSLSEVPKQITVGDSYRLPTSYKNVLEDTIVCKIDNKNELRDTKKMTIGNHVIECSGKSADGISVKVEKEIEVKDILEDDATFAGWIRLNLYYPEESTDWEYIIKSEDEVRNGGWKEYTGPILVRLEDIDKVYIRYKLASGESVIQPPNGKLLVDIEADKYNVEEGKKANITITYEEDADKKEYRINGGEWKSYTGSFQVEAGSEIDARVEKTILGKKKTNYDSVYIGLEVKNSSTSISRKINTGSYPEQEGYDVETGARYVPRVPSYVLDGPTIEVEPETIANKVKVRITTEKEARSIYYKIGSSDNYHLYNGEFEVLENTTIYAYYISEEEGQTSRTSDKYISNIAVKNKPNVSIRLSTTEKYQEKVDVEITTNGNNLEYSYDGEIYYPYTGVIEVFENKRIYAKAINENGETVTYRDITNIGNAPAVKKVDNIDINIRFNPEKEEVTGLINKAEVEINYGEEAEEKYYSINGSDYIKYEGKFEVVENSTITAYATSSNGYGETTRSISYLTTGISAPIINTNTSGAADEVKIDIDYAKTASIKKYRINDGEWKYYTEPFFVDSNCTIYAYNEDELGNKRESKKTISNVVAKKSYSIIDEGNYFLLTPNYPDNASEDSREYKWSPNGTWKKYNEQLGILLIKESAWDSIEKTSDGVKINRDGKEVIYEDHYYKVKDDFSDIIDDLYMRWDYATPVAPTIKLNDEEPTKEVEVEIEYDKYSSIKEYKTISPTGEESDWKKYTGKIKIEKNNTIIYARGTSNIGVLGKVGSKKITNIDEVKPTIETKGNLDTPTRSINLQVIGKDNLGVEKVGYIKGEKTLEELEEDGKIVYRDNVSINIEENGKYTLFVEDKVGNKVIKVIEVTNIDKEAPNIKIKVLTETFGTQAVVQIDYGDSSEKQYSIGNNTNYKEYTTELNLKSNDYLSLANPDKTLTIYAKGKDSAGNIKEVSEVIRVLDLDAPKKPVINASAGYPILTEYGINYQDNLTVEYDNTRDDILNYISTDGGASWHIYTGLEHATSGTIKAKSVKKSTGLTVETSKTITQPADAMNPILYNGVTTDSCRYSFYGSDCWIGSNSYLGISEKLEGDKIRVYWEKSGSDLNLTFYTSSKTAISSSLAEVNVQDVVVPVGARFVGITGSVYSGHRIREIELSNFPTINKEYVYPTLTEYGVKEGYTNVTISYYKTAVQKQYSLDNGVTWKEYTGKIKLSLGQTILARSIDKNGVVTKESSYVSTLPADAITSAAYDGNDSTYYRTDTNMKILISPEMIGQKIRVKSNDNRTVYFYSNGNKLSQFADDPYNTPTDNIATIPEGATSLEMSGYYRWIYEISVVTSPTIKDNHVYPKITEYGSSVSYANGIEAGYSNITINYYRTAVQKQYSLDNGSTWKEYTGNIKLSIGQKIQARSIDKNGTISQIAAYTSVLAEDAIGPEAYDGDISTEYTVRQCGGIRKISISPEMVGQTISANSSGNENFSFYNGDTEISKFATENLQYSGTSIIPEGATSLVFRGCYDSIREISVITRPTINYTQVYPTLTRSGVVHGYNELTINYFRSSLQKQYSLDNGATWKEYQGTFRIPLGQKIIARSIDKNGTISQTSELTATTPKAYIGPEAYDGDYSTYFSSGSYPRIAVAPEMIGQRIEINTSGSGYLIYIGENEKQLGNCSNNLVVPEGTKYIQNFYGGNIYEIRPAVVSTTTRSKSIKKSTSEVVNSPDIKVSTKDWAISKEVEITSNGYDVEYSYDAKVWTKYTGKLTINRNCTVYARSIDSSGLEVSSSSYKITKIDTESGDISLSGIPDEIVQGESYNVPTISEFNNISGGSSNCSVSGNSITNTNVLTVGEHIINCRAVTNAGIEININKKIKVKEKGSDEVEEETKSSESNEEATPEENTNKEAEGE